MIIQVKYTYKIIKVCNDTKTMDILYSSNEYGDLVVSGRLPYFNEALEDIVYMYNPSIYWTEKQKKYLDVSLNTVGEHTVELDLYK
jgi:hypothetical protein